MKARELAELLMEHPEFEIKAHIFTAEGYEEYDLDEPYADCEMEEFIFLQ